MPRLPVALALATLSAPLAAPLPAEADVPEVRLPREGVIVRDHCFGGGYEERRQRPMPMSVGGGYGAASPPPAPMPRTRTSSAPARKSMEVAEAASDDADAGGFALDMAPATEAVTGAVAGNQAGAGRARDDRAEQELDALGYVAPGAVAPRHPTPRVTWGGTVHLSNDDSMSLASAQRVLWAAEQGAPIPLEHVRPHELLNYFTFDTVNPPMGETFGVRASAVQQGDEVSLALSVQAATPPRSPLDLTLLVDRSGSMSSEGRMDYTKRALRLATDQLKHGDRVDLVLFDSTVCTPLENFVVGRDDPALLRRTIERMQPRGSTDLNSGLQTAYGLATGHAHDGRSGRVMVFTDAELNTGVVDKHVVTEVGEALDRHGIRLTGVGVGRTFRDDVLDMLTEKGRGAYVFLGSERVVDRLFGSGFDALVQTVAEDVRFALQLPDSLGMTRFYGEESSRDPADVKPVHIHAGTSQLFLQDLAVRPGTDPRRDTVTLSATWTDPATGRKVGRSYPVSVAAALGADPHDVHKAKALMSWTDALYAQAMGGSACEARDAFVTAWSRVPEDAELAYVAGLYGRTCDVTSPPVAMVPLHLKLDADVAITDVQLACAGHDDHARLGSGERAATLTGATGVCRLTLYGPVPMVASVDLPETGRDVRCVARGGRLSCR